MAWWKPSTWGSGRQLDVNSTDLAKASGKKGAPDQPKAWKLESFDAQYSLEEEHNQTQHPGTMGLDFDTLRSMARTADISAIVTTRVAQVAEFAVPQPDKHAVGYKFRLRDRDAQPTKAQRKRIVELTDWMLTCGDPRIDPEATFDHFVRQTIRDSIVFDQAAFEVIRTRGGKIAGMSVVDASTVRRTRPTSRELARGRRDPNRRAFVQVVDDKVVADWKLEDFCLGIRRPRSWIKARGYGYPELEELVNVVTWMINADVFNSNNFKNGLHSSGVLALVSKMNPSLFRAFRREFYAMLKGAQNSKKTPIIQLDPDNKEDLKAVNLSHTNREMEFKEWRGDLRKLACAIFLIDAAELGWVYGAEGQTIALSQAGPADRIAASRDRGLRPLVRSLETWINRKIIHPLAPEFELQLAGFDVDSEAAALAALLQKAGSFMTVNEARAEWDLPALESPAADMPLNPVYAQNAQNAEMARQQEEAEEGALSADGGGGGGEEPPQISEADQTTLDRVLGGGGGGGGVSDADQETLDRVLSKGQGYRETFGGARIVVEVE